MPRAAPLAVLDAVPRSPPTRCCYQPSPPPPCDHDAVAGLSLPLAASRRPQSGRRAFVWAGRQRRPPPRHRSACRPHREGRGGPQTSPAGPAARGKRWSGSAEVSRAQVVSRAQPSSGGQPSSAELRWSAELSQAQGQLDDTRRSCPVTVCRTRAQGSCAHLID